MRSCIRPVSRLVTPPGVPTENFRLDSVTTVPNPTAKGDCGGAGRTGQAAIAPGLWRGQGFACALRALLLVVAALSAPAYAQTSAASDPTTILAEAGPGTRWGLVVVDDTGREVLAIDPDDRFIPASNTKIFTTAAAMWAMSKGELPDAGAPDGGGGARVRLEPAARGKPANVVLEGRGDARMSAAADCVSNCLAALADAVAARTKVVRDVVGDDTLFPDQRWSPGMSWNNIPTDSGTGISALTVDDNEIHATVTAGAEGAAPVVSLPAYYSVENHAVTIAGDKVDLEFDRAPNGKVLVLSGTIGVAAKPETLQLGVDDPAHYAAWRLAEMLRARGVKVTGNVASRHRPLLPIDDPKKRDAAARLSSPDLPALAVLAPPPLGEDVRLVNKVSQNLHAELLLHRLGLIRGTGSLADGHAVVRAMLDEAGVPKNAVSLSDGSGMSTYNRVSPRGMTKLLGWIARQPWGAAWRETLPVGGRDGTLARRFGGGVALDGKLMAKTGTLNATNALAGYMTAASGRTLTFAIYANDVPEDVRATQFMDRALLAIAAAN
jgi:serine-type D-Ala-D-Ala carboxypeptidase/endopeptidase (penicillin-binding protein 4)